MKRNIEKIKKEKFDLLVTGGGIHGAMLFWQASVSGIRTALVEKGDFAGATSANSQKIIHGGLRYLQSFNLPRIRQSVRERRRFLKIAPHLVRPLPCIMPLYGHGMKGPEAMWAGLHAYNLLSFDRNRGLPPSSHIPRGRIISSSDTVKTLPDLTGEGLLGGAGWSDAICLNTERMIIELIKAAVKNGGTAANYLEVTGIQRDGDQVTGAEVSDRLKEESFTIQAGQVAACVGPWINNFIAAAGLEGEFDPFPFAAAVNIVVKRKFTPKHAFAIRSNKEKGRLFFVVPWNGKSIIGTEYFQFDGDPDNLRIRSNECEKLLYEFNLSCPEAGLKKEDIQFVHKGLLPCDPTDSWQEHPPGLTSEFKIIDFEKHGFRGLTGVLGVKYTTAGHVAEKLLSRIFPDISGKNLSIEEQMESENLLDFPDTGSDPAEGKRGLREEEVDSLLTSFGAGYGKVLELAEVDENGKIRKSSFLRAIILFSIREEMAAGLSDILLRRSAIASSGLPAPEVVEESGRIMQQELGWSDEKLAGEIELFYKDCPCLKDTEPTRKKDDADA